jgi:hypothetical protein
MALYSFAYDELVTCPTCGSVDFTFIQSLQRLRCNSCKDSFSEATLVEEAVTTMSDYIRSNGIVERLTPDSIATREKSSDYQGTTTLAALLTALDVLTYPHTATPAKLLRAQRMVSAALERERRRETGLLHGNL